MFPQKRGRYVLFFAFRIPLSHVYCLKHCLLIIKRGVFIAEIAAIKHDESKMDFFMRNICGAAGHIYYMR